MHHIILRDCEHPLLEGDASHILGDHDDPSEDVHCHYSILTVEHGLVVNVDWGYHAEDEASDHSDPALHDDLLTACRNALAALTDPYLGEDDGERQQPEIQELTAVIARAEGQRGHLTPDPGDTTCPGCVGETFSGGGSDAPSA